MIQHRLDSHLFQKLVQQAQHSSRKRSHYLLHQSHHENVQRLCIALIKGTYIRPHCHCVSQQWELLTLLQGRARLILFDTDGVIQQQIELSAAATSSIELTANCWHSLIPETEQAVIMEIKPGPYQPISEQELASWAPPEQHPEAGSYLNWMSQATAGMSYSKKRIYNQ